MERVQSEKRKGRVQVPLDEEKIRLMTRITIYEKEHENDELVLSHYYREDYVRYGCIRTIIVATITYWSAVAMYILYRFQELLKEINSMDYFDVIGKLMLGYVGFLAVLYIFAFFVYHIRFQMAKRGLIEYNRNLKLYLKWEEKNEGRQNIASGVIRVSRNIGGDDMDLEPERDDPAERGQERKALMPPRLRQEDLEETEAGKTGEEADGTEAEAGNTGEEADGTKAEAGKTAEKADGAEAETGKPIEGATGVKAEDPKNITDAVKKILAADAEVAMGFSKIEGQQENEPRVNREEKPGDAPEVKDEKPDEDSKVTDRKPEDKTDGNPEEKKENTDGRSDDGRSAEEDDGAEQSGDSDVTEKNVPDSEEGSI